MFLFFGISPRISRHGSVSVNCQVHGGQAPHEVASIRSWFKLFFFLPLFPVGRERHVLTCMDCGASSEVSRATAQELLAGVSSADPAGDQFRTTPRLSPEPPFRVTSRRVDRK